jgi:hypothetical protein
MSRLEWRMVWILGGLKALWPLFLVVALIVVASFIL